ncbi:MAG: hypothetical protein GX442_21110 [Candidatus Riflebacteria bacterium]|nr:hypothetical protein [Candidatus Riflebacteria bacterium]
MKSKANGCPSLERLVEYANRPRSAARDPALEKHLKTCPTCRFTVTPAPLPRPADLEGKLDALNDAMQRQPPDSLAFGQLWRIAFPGGNRAGVITFDTRESADPDQPDVRVVPVCFTAEPAEIDAGTDLLLAPRDSTLGLRGLLETWNERPVLARQLTVFLGTMTAAAARRLHQALAPDRARATVSPTIEWFRQARIAEGERMSAPYFAARRGLPVPLPDDLDLFPARKATPRTSRTARPAPAAANAREALAADADSGALADLQFRFLKAQAAPGAPRFVVRPTTHPLGLRVAFGPKHGELAVALLQRGRIVARFLTTGGELAFQLTPEGCLVPAFDEVVTVPYGED